jgi:hypothetical protein
MEVSKSIFPIFGLKMYEKNEQNYKRIAGFNQRSKFRFTKSFRKAGCEKIY